MKSFYAACLALSITPATFADTTMEFDAQGDGEPQVFLVKNGKVLMRSEREDMLYEAGRLTMIDHDSRGYFVMDPEVMAERSKAMRGQMQQQMQQMQQQMGPMMEEMQQMLLENPDIPESQKAMIRQQIAQMAGGGMAGNAAGMPKREPMTVTATGTTRKVNGITCKVHRVSQSARTVQEICVASHQAAGVPRADYDALRDMFAFLRKMAEESMAAMGMGNAAPAFPEFDGVPVEIKDLEDGTVSTLRKVSTRGLDAAAFKVPAGYRQHDPFTQ